MTMPTPPLSPAHAILDDPAADVTALRDCLREVVAAYDQQADLVRGASDVAAQAESRMRAVSETCPTCNGGGNDDSLAYHYDEPPEPCPRCMGVGLVPSGLLASQAERDRLRAALGGIVKASAVTLMGDALPDGKKRDGLVKAAAHAAQVLGEPAHGSDRGAEAREIVGRIETLRAEICRRRDEAAKNTRPYDEYHPGVEKAYDAVDDDLGELLAAIAAAGIKETP